MLNYYWEIVYCDLSFVDEFVRMAILEYIALFTSILK